jgi:two-component system, NtrC family, nitrogen regulation sensor histidine kinase NtrY
LHKEISLKRFFYNHTYLLVIAAWLVTISFIIDNYWSVNSSARAVQKNITAKIHREEKEVENLAADTASLTKLVLKKYDEQLLKKYLNKKHFLFVYPAFEPYANRILFWNTQTVLPDSSIINAKDSCGFKRIQNGYFVWRRVMAGPYLCVALIPVKWDYHMDNIYLQNIFTAGDRIADNYDISDTEGIAAISSLHGSSLFFLSRNAGVIIQSNTTAAAWLRMLATFCLLLFIHLIAGFFAQRYKVLWGCLFLIGVVVSFRVLSYFYPIPLNFRQFDLFDPEVYASDEVLKSLGDLLINAVLFVWLALFVRQQIYENSNTRLPGKKWQRIFVAIAGALLLIAATLTGGHILLKMVADSHIPFDVINFSRLNIYSAIGFLVLCFIAIGYFLLAQVVLFFLKPVFEGKILLLYFTVAVCGLLYLSFKFDNVSIDFDLFTVCWLLLFLLLLNNSFWSLPGNVAGSSKLIFWLFFFSVSITTVIVQQNNKKEKEQREHYAETLGNKADPNNERILNTMITDFNANFLENNFSRFKQDAATSHALKDSVVSSNFSGYTSRYKTKIFIFDASQQPLYNPDSTTFTSLTAIINTQAQSTNKPGLYYYDEAYDRFSYIFRKEVKDTGGLTQGFVIIRATPMEYKNEALYPELFFKGTENAIENSPDYAFAVYNKGNLVSRHNDYSFPTSLQEAEIPEKQEPFTHVFKNGYDELWYKDGPGKVVVITRERKFFIESITLFSYLFCSFLLITAALWLLNAFVRSRFKTERWRKYFQLTIRNQVHATIIFISVLSFIVIGIATILFFKNRYENTNKEKLSKAIQLMERQVSAINDIEAFDDEIKLYDSLNLPRLKAAIGSISDIHAVEINLYGLDGNLKLSSYPLPYEKGIVSAKINPEAFYHLSMLREAQYFTKESIGNLTYLSNYLPVIDKKGRVSAYLNIPYFTSQANLKQEISNFFVAIINLNAFIFLIAGIVALFIANRITRSFSFISDKMRDVNLGKLNEAIVWNRNDEIGLLVSEYNKMVAKLDESAAAFAKSEREDAWREMARQVAHEIKNPLTPMKLSLQYLQKSINSNAPNVNELSASVAQTLVEQIGHLSQIAGEFGQFANIGNPKKEIFDLNELLKLVAQLHVAENSLLTWQFWPQPVMVHADRTHINRLFTNLLQNAMQSVPEGKQPVIRVENSVSDSRVLITVTDNGSGIPEEMQSKIFTPNFTTKTSGTGLGLAMCKGIVEQAGGRIWFETKLDVGTAFYVELPLAGE